MKAMVLKGPNLPFQLEQRPDPTAGPGEAVARVITCGAGLTIQHAKAGGGRCNSPASSATRSPARSSRSAQACAA
jgi:threonine dehydrogenase-like Zn-dependent dehydrogenase